MKIAQVAPLYESVPPRYYGGTERVVSYLTEELIRLGHEVTLFASGDSITAAELIPCSTHGLRLADCRDPLAFHLTMLGKVSACAADFDIIHYHIDYLHFPVSRQNPSPSLTTLHGRLDLAELQMVYDEFNDQPVVSISHAQQQPLPQANWLGTVYHGLPKDLHRFNPKPQGYLAFLGRISAEKRLDRAIEIAVRMAMPIKIAAKIDPSDRAYFEQHIRHLFDHPLVEYIGEIGEHEKGEFLGNASALLFPIDWPEPFGLVMIEAMACGTPVIAFRKGAVPEIVEDGITGFIVDDMESAVIATHKALQLNRERCRAEFQRRFTVTRMAKDYLQLYAYLIPSFCHEKNIAAATISRYEVSA